MSGLDEVIEQYHRTLEAFGRGDPEPTLTLWSKQDDVTLANPFGPPVRGWKAVRETSERAAAQVADGEAYSAERISTYATTDLGYLVEIQRFRAKVGGADAATPVSLRVTTIFRREKDGWRIVHRHADPITGERPAESLLQP
jgi:ketosteroid isomerase-like protein